MKLASDEPIISADKFTALVRVAVTAMVGGLISFLSRNGLSLPEDWHDELTSALTVLFIVGFYVLYRFLLQYIPGLKWLMGVPKIPVYVPDDQENRAIIALREKGIK